MATFEDENPSLENYWRAVVLFGRNVASYKFALAKSLLELSAQNRSTVTYEELAIPFSTHITEHLKLADKQGTSSGSKFLDACRKFNENELSQDALVSTTAKLGFVNVIDAFHIVNNKEIPVRFFHERSDKRGIDLSDQFFELSEFPQFENLSKEAESRWRLVETAWALNISRSLITVFHDDESQSFYARDRSLSRVNITSSKSALNGYQKGKCFYCFVDLSLNDSESGQITDVDHFFAHALKQHDGFKDINSVWNLVLSCYDCNRGPGGKFAWLPEIRFLERLHKRNEFLISSQHPLRETLIQQTGSTDMERCNFLNKYYSNAVDRLIHKWSPRVEHAPVF